MKATAQTDKDLHEKIGDELVAAGHPSQTIPDPLHVFEGITNAGGEVVSSVGYDSDKFFNGEGLQTGERTTGSNNWLKSLKEKAIMKIKKFQKGTQKPV